jgi:twinkle protein
MISESTIQHVKEAMNIREIISDHVPLKKKGVNFLGLCPFHVEKSPSLTVSESKQIFKCFGCGKSGDAIAFIVEHEKVSYIEAIKKIAVKYGIPVEESEKVPTARPIPRLEKLDAKTLHWFENDRRISNNTLLRFRITQAMHFMPQLDQEIEAICFNYYRNDELINIKFRGPKKSFMMSKNAELIFYNLDAIKDEKECIITEGEIDCLSLYEAGIYNAVSVPNGATVGKQRLEYLDNCYGYFTGKEKIILATDNDYPGNNLREELARRLGKDRCYQLVYPDGCKDLNDVLVKHGKDAVRAVIEAATRWPVEGLMPMDEIFPDVLEYYENGYPKGDDTKISDFDLLLAPGELTVVTGIPGSGKDEFVNYITTSLSRYHDWNWGYWGMEERPPITTTKLAEKFTGKCFSFRKNPEHRMSRSEFEYAIGMIDKHYHFVQTNKVDISIEGIIAKAIEMVERFGINGMVISPWNCVEHKMAAGISETLYISEMLTLLINFLERYGVHCLLIAHPKKMEKNRQTGKYNIPTLYDVSGSANFFNKIHNGLSVYRDFQTNQVDIYRQKIKNWWNGSLGYSSYHFDINTRQYLQIGATPSTEGNWKPIPASTPAPVNYSEPVKESTSGFDEEEEMPF